jgi:hypothetical protein
MINLLNGDLFSTEMQQQFNIFAMINSDFSLNIISK